MKYNYFVSYVMNVEERRNFYNTVVDSDKKINGLEDIKDIEESITEKIWETVKDLKETKTGIIDFIKKENLVSPQIAIVNFQLLSEVE